MAHQLSRRVDMRMDESERSWPELHAPLAVQRIRGLVPRELPPAAYHNLRRDLLSPEKQFMTTPPDDLPPSSHRTLAEDVCPVFSCPVEVAPPLHWTLAEDDEIRALSSADGSDDNDAFNMLRTKAHRANLLLEQLDLSKNDLVEQLNGWNNMAQQTEGERRKKIDSRRQRTAEEADKMQELHEMQAGNSEAEKRHMQLQWECNNLRLRKTELSERGREAKQRSGALVVQMQMDSHDIEEMSTRCLVNRNIIVDMHAKNLMLKEESKKLKERADALTVEYEWLKDKLAPKKKKKKK
jgi:hypothetical protein